MGQGPPLHVVIATHGRPALLRRTLDSLAECEHPESYQTTVVVENGSKAGAEEVVRAHEETLNARYLYMARGNKSHALNQALEIVEEGLVFFTDDDVRVHPDVLVRYSKAAQRVGKGTYFSGPTDVDYQEPPPDWLLPSLPASAVGWDQDSDWHYALGFNWAAFAEDVRSCDGFDEERGPGSGNVGQETDMQKRLEEAGVEQHFVDGALVWHYVPEERCNPRWLLRRYYRMGKGDVQGDWEVSGRWLGFNRWTWKIFGSHLRQVLAAVLTTDRGRAFRALLKLVRHIGRMKKGVEE